MEVGEEGEYIYRGGVGGEGGMEVGGRGRVYMPIATLSPPELFLR